MSLSDISDTLLTAIVNYGALVVGLVVLLAAIGAPLPSTFFVLASGAFVQQGVLDMPTAIAAVLVGAVLGDTTSYGMGRLLRRPIITRYGESAAWKRAEEYVGKRGALAVFLSRWLLTPIAVPINLVAGSSDFPTKRFVSMSFAGESVWLVLYGTLGYVFGSQWETISDLVSNFSGVLAGAVLVAGGCYAVFRLLRRPAVAPVPIAVVAHQGDE